MGNNEEKKYYLEVKMPIEITGEDRFLNYKEKHNSYFLRTSLQTRNIKTQFTQKEINNLPFNADEYFNKVLTDE